MAGEPSSYAWSVSGASFAVGGVQGFTGIDTSNPLDTENGQSTPSSLTHAAPAITTTIANAMLVASHAFASSRTWSPPTGMSESFDRPSGANNATGLSIEGSRLLQAVAGSTGTKTATAAGNADAGNAHLLALRPAKANLVISTPSGTAAGDVMIAAIGFNNAGAALTPPSGWTLIRRMDNTSSTANSLAVYRRTAAAGEPSSHTWAVAGGAFLVGGIQSFSGVDPANPIDAESGQTTASATAHDTPSITTGSANAMLVTAHAFASSQSWTPQAGLTESFDRPSGSAGSTGQSISGGRQIQAAPGASGAKRATAASSADRGNTHILALRQFVPNAPPTVSITSPASGANFSAPANIVVTATAADSDGSIQKVEFFHGGTNLITTITAAPYSFTWTGVPQGAYSLTAVATDNLNGTTTSAPVNVTVNHTQALHFIHVDHLNTPRLVSNQSGQAVWRWDQQEPFGVNVSDENPSSLGTFEFPLRFPGQYFDPETGSAQNWFRDYTPDSGRYLQSDSIGIYGGLGTYNYAALNPLIYSDRTGEWVWVAAGAGIGAVTNVAVTYAWNAYNGQPTTSSQLIAAAASGAIAGAYGALGGPLGGTVARWLGTKANGAIGVAASAIFSGAGGYVGQVAANYIDPCNPADPLNAALWSGIGGAAVAPLIPTPGMYTIAQAKYFQPQTFPAINSSPLVRSYAASAGLGGGSVSGWPIPNPPAGCACKPQ